MSHTLPPSGNTAHTRPENRAFYPALDGLRALAFLMVFGQHYLLLPWGWTGVNVFFILSGFLITGILFDTRDDLHRFRNFYVRRSLRIFPLYWGLFALLLLTTPLFHWRWTPAWLAWPLYLGNMLRFLSPAGGTLETPFGLVAAGHLTSAEFPRSELFLGHLWSLCIEEQFYLVWPLVVFSVRNRQRLIWLCLATLLVVPILRVLAGSLLPGWLLAASLQYSFLPFQLDSLLLGALLALLWRGSHRDLLLRAARGVAWVLGVVAAVYLLHSARLWPTMPYLYPVWSYTGGMPFANVLAAAVMLRALSPGSRVYRALRWRPLRWMGRLSYGAYLFHDLLHGLYVHLVVALSGDRMVIDNNPRRFVVAALALVCTMALAALSFRFFEGPFLNLKDRWTRTGQTRPG